MLSDSDESPQSFTGGSFHEGEALAEAIFVRREAARRVVPRWVWYPTPDRHVCSGMVVEDRPCANPIGDEFHHQRMPQKSCLKRRIEHPQTF